MNIELWRDELKDVLPRVKTLRREFHAHPEVGGCEKETQRRIIALLEELGVAYRTFDDCYGVMATIHNGEGRCIAIRADMDALPIVEKSGVPFASENEGTMHACGHDVHMSMALGSLMYLNAHRELWHGTIKWIFEPAEETFGGGRLMVEQGCLEDPKAACVLGQHVNPAYEAGVFFSRPGYVSGSSDEIRIRVTGERCHGAYPEKGVDAIVIAGQVVSALQMLVSRNVSPFDPVVVTIGTIEGGTANNIVCGEVRMRGTLRTLSGETRDKMKARIVQTAEGVARAMGGDAQVEIEPGYGAVYNHDAYYARVEALAKEIAGEEKIIIRDAASLGVESFCFFLQDTAGVYYDLGSGVSTALHTDTFTVDETCMDYGVALQCAAAIELLKEE